jgi:hypothetical protein
MDVTDIIGKDEEVVEVVYKHWANVAPLMSGFLLLSGLALYGLYLLAGNSQSFQRIGSPGLASLALVAIVAFGLVLAYISWVVYRENRLIVTTENLYKVTKYSLFSRAISQFGLLRMQDVTAAQNGIFASMLGYGTVTIETAGEEENFMFRQVPDPQNLASRIMAYHHKALAGAAEHPTEP